MSTDLRVIVDDSSSAFSYTWSGGSNSSNPWTQNSLPQWYRVSSRYPNSATQPGIFNFTFNGTSVTFIGNTPPSPLPLTATVQIDNGSSFGINFDDPTPQTYKQWYTTPTLPAGQHTVTVSDFYSTSIDYAVVKVGNETPLSGQTVIVDDSSSMIQYSGQWTRNTNKFIPGGLASGYPYGNVTHRSSNPGDTFTFQFSGTSVAVYGIFSWYNFGLLAATYSLDGTPYPLSTVVTSSSNGYLNNYGEASNNLFFSQENLSPGTHTLFVNITQAINQTFILDYITYQPSFDTLSSMPALSSNVALSSSSTPLSSHSQTPSTAAPLATSSGSNNKSQTGAIVGGVVGGLAFGALLTLLIVLFILHRRHARERNDNDYLDARPSFDDTNRNLRTLSVNPQMQEHLSPTQLDNDSIRPSLGNSKSVLIHMRSTSNTSTDSRGVVSSLSTSSMAVEAPPSYEAIPSRLSRQP